MSEELYIILLDNSNNTIEEINLPKKPNNYQNLLLTIQQNLCNLPEYYKIFFQSEKNSITEIHNNKEYLLSKDILFIQEIEPKLEESLFQLNYNKLSEQFQEKIDERYDCLFCSMIIKNENPYFCYECQKIFHYNCLKQWEKKRKDANQKFNCPNCRNELPLEHWKKKINFEENRINEAKNMDKMNQCELNYKINNIIYKVKDKKNIQLKNDIIQQNKKIGEIFKNILNKINELNFLLTSKNNNKITNLINELSKNFNIQNLDNISTIIINEMESFKKYFKKEHIIENKNKNSINVEAHKNYKENKTSEDKVKDKDNNHIDNTSKNYNINDILNNEIKISYKINNNTNIKVFGYNFVKNNKEKCKILYQDNLYELTEYFNVSDYVKDNNIPDILDIKLTSINEITDMSYMFYAAHH